MLGLPNLRFYEFSEYQRRCYPKCSQCCSGSGVPWREALQGGESPSRSTVELHPPGGGNTRTGQADGPATCSCSVSLSTTSLDCIMGAVVTLGLRVSNQRKQYSVDVEPWGPFSSTKSHGVTIIFASVVNQSVHWAVRGWPQCPEDNHSRGITWEG